MEHSVLRLFRSTAATLSHISDRVETMCTARGQLRTCAHFPRSDRFIHADEHPVHILSSRVQPAAEQLDTAAERIIHRDVLFDLVDRMDHRRMVAAAEKVADLDQ